MGISWRPDSIQPASGSGGVLTVTGGTAAITVVARSLWVGHTTAHASPTTPTRTDAPSAWGRCRRRRMRTSIRWATSAASTVGRRSATASRTISSNAGTIVLFVEVGAEHDGESLAGSVQMRLHRPGLHPECLADRVDRKVDH